MKKSNIFKTTFKWVNSCLGVFFLLLCTHFYFILGRFEGIPKSTVVFAYSQALALLFAQLLFAHNESYLGERDYVLFSVSQLLMLVNLAIKTLCPVIQGPAWFGVGDQTTLVHLSAALAALLLFFVAFSKTERSDDRLNLLLGGVVAFAVVITLGVAEFTQLASLVEKVLVSIALGGAFASYMGVGVLPSGLSVLGKGLLSSALIIYLFGIAFSLLAQGWIAVFSGSAAIMFSVVAFFGILSN